MTLIVNYIIVYGLYYIYVCLHRVESDRIKLDYIGYPHIRVGSDTGFRSDTPKSISNPYLFKKIGFIHIHIHYPVNGFFYCLTGSDQMGNPRIGTHLPSIITIYK